MFQLLSVLIAIFSGYTIKNIPVSMNRLNLILSIVIQLILFVMGYQFGSSALNLFGELYNLSKLIIVFVSTLFIFNLVFVNLILKKKTKVVVKHSEPLKLWVYIKSSMKYLVYVILGIVIGALLGFKLGHIDYIISALLLCALFIIGHQLRAQDINLAKALLNKIGLSLTLIIVISSLLAGVVSALILGLPVKLGLVLSSGFGWYTLSGILVGSMVDQHMGTGAFFIDFFREIIALIFVPMMGRKYIYASIGYCGATALDFTLPILKENIGEEIVPIAITSGMILSLLVPFLIPLFWQL